MALSRSKLNELPADAKIISENDALNYQWKIISNWENGSDVWALRYTPGIISFAAAATGIYINNHYRNILRLKTHGRFSTYLPIVVIPAMFSALTHRFFVQRPIILNPLGECPVCVQLRAAAFQTGLGVVYPTLLAPSAAFLFATRCFTYRLPSITENPKAVLQLWRKFTRPIVPVLTTVMLMQALLAMFLTSKEEKQSFGLLLKMKEIENKIDEELLAKQQKF